MDSHHNLHPVCDIQPRRDRSFGRFHTVDREYEPSDPEPHRMVTLDMRRAFDDSSVVKADLDKSETVIGNVERFEG